jgi:hypothetical protein
MVLWWFFPVIFIAGAFKSTRFKGYFGELLVRLSARLVLDRKIYHPIHNVTLPTPDGTTQIDHIFVSRFGIFVVETKNLKGWIFGNEKQATWTQKIYKKSFKFQNPLRQNFKHVKALEDALQVPAGIIHSVIVFVGSSTFKTAMPPNVTYASGYVRYIKSKRKPVLSDAQIEEIIDKIESGRLEPTLATHRAHVQFLRNRSNPKAERNCPKCASPMVLRSARRGAQASSKFWGCSAYPKCRIVQKVT